MNVRFAAERSQTVFVASTSNSTSRLEQTDVHGRFEKTRSDFADIILYRTNFLPETKSNAAERIVRQHGSSREERERNNERRGFLEQSGTFKSGVFNDDRQVRLGGGNPTALRLDRQCRNELETGLR